MHLPQGRGNRLGGQRVLDTGQGLGGAGEVPLPHGLACGKEEAERKGRPPAGAWRFPLGGRSTRRLRRPGGRKLWAGRPPVALRPGSQPCFCPFHAVALGKDTVPSLCLGPPSKSSGLKAHLRISRATVPEVPGAPSTLGAWQRAAVVIVTT